MNQFINGADSSWRDLNKKAARNCIRFKDQEMPPGCVPSKAHVGFEIDPGSQAAVLFVQNGVTYTGSSDELRYWFRSGEKRFPDFSKLRHWVCTELGSQYAARHKVATEAVGSPVEITSQPLTDMSAVQQGILEVHRPLYLDEANLFERLHRRVLGQDNALRSLSGVMARHCARKQPARPAVLFAVGPSGVGKTRSAEVVAQVLREFGDENNGYQFLRLDMTEYSEPHRVSQLIGAPQGYVGHGEGSQLVDALRANPRTIVLFDEIEKAHVAILRVLMNAMDAGRLSTASRSTAGREIDCRQAIFMFTSNLDAKSILDELESRKAFGNRAVEDDVCRRRLQAAGIAPEIIGRIGRFRVYRPLPLEVSAEIMTLAIVEVAEEYGVQVGYIAPNVIVDLMHKTRQENFGVRPSRYLIDDTLGFAFAKAAEQGVTGPVNVAGPPYVCSPHNNNRHKQTEVPQRKKATVLLIEHNSRINPKNV